MNATTETSGQPDIATFAAAFLKRETGADEVEVHDCKRLGGGAIQENLALAVTVRGGPWDGRHELVLRTDSPSSLAVSLSRAEEFAVLQAAFAAGVTVPEPLWLHRDQGEFGKDFYLMRKAGGSAAARPLVRGDLTPDERDALVAQLGTELARLHSVRPPVAALDFLPLPDGSPALSRVREYRRHIDAIGRPQPTLEWALRWLELNAPTSTETTLTHGDFRTGNYMVEGGRLSAVLDWEFAGWSDPMEDLGWLCARCWRFGAWDNEVGGVGGSAALARGYESVSARPLDLSLLPYWKVMGTMRWAVIALMQAERHLSGEQPSLELALTGRMLPEIELDLIQEIQSIEKERARHA
ncbi:phosphotransferase family protein [Zoogloea sp.]|uniref:phosphotransferase family protein n=1 Tax=Zoogloea sp. TaxID=49181 RepID=UPI002603F3B3|nr:phosphotransferase family protein [Zoogloea sp.]MDD3352972.1 phosphotransferase family protein [Zoogloea sp.]